MDELSILKKERDLYKKALEDIVENWDCSDPEYVTPRIHDGEMGPNDSLAAGAILHCSWALIEGQEL